MKKNETEKYERLKLDNQLCFPLYALSRLVTHQYQPYFDKMNITYPQYLVLLVLWESNEEVSVNVITKKLILNTNTVTPLLKRMEAEQLITRMRSKTDERKVMIGLTDKGLKMKEEALNMSCILSEEMVGGPLSMEELLTLHSQIWKLINFLQNKDTF